MKSTMKLILGPILFLACLSCFGQTTWSHVGGADSSKQALPLELNEPVSLIQGSAFYVFNHDKDTIFLSSLSRFGPWTQCKKYKIKDSIQVDQKGAMEMVFFRKCFCLIEEHGATYDISEKITFKKYEVWDLDNKKLLFEAMSTYRVSFDRYFIHQEPRRKKGRSYYRYKFSMNSSGQIKLSKFLRVGRKYPDNQKGTYVFSAGNYMYQK